MGVDRATLAGFRRQVPKLVVRAKNSGDAEERFGPTLAVEHLAEEDGLEVDVVPGALYTDWKNETR